jgi:hypothetical protein
VIEHGVLVPESARYTGELARGLVVVNHLRRRGRRLGADVFEQVRRHGLQLMLGIDGHNAFPAAMAVQDRSVRADDERRLLAPHHRLSHDPLFLLAHGLSHLSRIGLALPGFCLHELSHGFLRFC